MNLLNFLHPLAVVCWFFEPQSTMMYPDLGFHTVAISVPGLLELWRYIRILIRGRDVILPVSGATSTLTRGATLAVRLFHEHQPISNQPVGLGFPHRAERCRPGGSPFLSPKLLELWRY